MLCPACAPYAKFGDAEQDKIYVQVLEFLASLGVSLTSKPPLVRTTWAALEACKLARLSPSTSTCLRSYVLPSAVAEKPAQICSFTRAFRCGAGVAQREHVPAR